MVRLAANDVLHDHSADAPTALRAFEAARTVVMLLPVWQLHALSLIPGVP